MSSTLEQFDPELIEKLQALFRIGPDNPISIRAICPAKGRPTQNHAFTARNHPDVLERWRAAIECGLALNDGGLNVYTIMNPISPDYQSGAVNRSHILCRRLLLVDLDRTETGGQPATDAEIAEAAEVADRIEDWMRRSDEIALARIMSGNGVHLYFSMDDLPNDTRSGQLCRALLHRLAGRFDTATIKIDTGVWDAPRITKLPGTIARKGEETPERPHRRAKFLWL